MRKRTDQGTAGVKTEVRKMKGLLKGGNQQLLWLGNNAYGISFQASNENQPPSLMLFPFLKFFWSQGGYLILSSLTTGMVHRQLPSWQKFRVFPLSSGCPQTFITSNTPVPLIKRLLLFPVTSLRTRRGTRPNSNWLRWIDLWKLLPTCGSFPKCRGVVKIRTRPPPPKRCIFLSFPEITLIWGSCWRNSNPKEELGIRG